MAQPASGPRVLTVGDVVAGLKQLLDDRVGRIWIVGQISNLARPRSGHVYFTLKDDRGQLRAAMFQSTARRVAFEPEEGMEVLAYGDLTVYEARGELQLVVRQLEPQGVGALQLAFEQLRRKLDAEGLFDPARKRELPPLPERIAVVTSPTGAALRDVLAVSGRRLPSQRLLVVPTRVQGLGAEHEVAEALARAGACANVEVVLLVRGGGSLEDLQAFNTEVVARAIAACPVPVVCGVGHETDTTIADAAADLRAPTPSAAAEAAVPAREQLQAELFAGLDGLVRAMEDRIAGERERLGRCAQALRHLSPQSRLEARRQRLGETARRLSAAARSRALRSRRRLEQLAGRLAQHSPAGAVAAKQARVDALSLRLERASRAQVDVAGHRLAQLGGRLDSLSPLAVLGRGYAIAKHAASNAILRGAEDVAPGDAIEVRVERAEVSARVEHVRPLAAPGDGAPQD
jgi:exodeoxyribonuclease VII large subunit